VRRRRLLFSQLVERNKNELKMNKEFLNEVDKKIEERHIKVTTKGIK